MANFRPAIASMSLGRAWVHDFDNKITQAAKHGFEGIEIFYEDLEYLAKEIAKSDSPPTPDQILTAAKHIRTLTDSLNLTIIGLQPFLFYDGLLDREEHTHLATTKINLWFQIAKTLNTTTIQIPANFLPAHELTSSTTIIANDLRKLADLGLQQTPIIRFAYEPLCFSTHISTWEQGWSIVQEVDRPNFGLCLDTFNIAGRIYADPTTPDGKTPNADSDLKQSLQRMTIPQNLDPTKIFYIQVVDAERLSSPLVKGHTFYDETQPARMSWSRNARTFCYETDRGAYLPVEEVTRVIVEEVGYKGFVSMELFSRTLAEEGRNVPEEHARRGWEAWMTLKGRLELN